jgi:hypothetical protein
LDHAGPLRSAGGKDQRSRQALQRLFQRLGESKQLSQYRDASTLALIEALASLIGVAAASHPIIQAKLDAEALAEQSKQGVIKLAGPQLSAFFEAAFKDGAFTTYMHGYMKEKADLSALDALSPAERAHALFGCLRAFNFISHWGRNSQAKPWPECKLSSFPSADYPRIADYAEQGYSQLLLGPLFQNIARRKLDLDEEMQWELLRLLRSPAAAPLVQSLQVVKIVEAFAKGNRSARICAELEAAIEWLRGVDGHYDTKFKAAALHRLEAALSTMAVEPSPVAASSPSAVPAFGRRLASETPASVSASQPQPETGRLAPPTVPGRYDLSMTAITDFYGDLADLRKCTPEHVALIDELIARDADPATELRRTLEAEVKELRAQGLSRELMEAAVAMRALGAHGILRAGRYRSLLEQLKGRMETAAKFGEAVQAVWPAFHAHARKLYGKSKPASAWLKEARAILDRISADEQVELVKVVLAGFPLGRQMPSDEAVRGLVYCAAKMQADKVGPAVSDFARKECFQTIPGVGIRDKRMGNACLWTLINMSEGRGVPYLARLLARIKYPSVKKTINAALDEAAAKAGISRGTLDELSVPTHDLEAGRAEIPIGPDGGAAVLEIVGTAGVSMSFRRADGKASASVPAELKAFKSDIATARTVAKEIEADLTTQVARLQRIWLERRDWSFADWTARYASHPLVAQLARRLIWDVGEGAERKSAILLDGALHDVEGKPLPDSESRVSLWHPIGRPVAEVLAWRKRLAALGIMQPFKQAHREVYYVTDAERATGVYSNRFAGHILRQHQMMTLARLNHWNVTHRIWADVPNDQPTHLVIPAWNIVAELWTTGAGGDSPEVSDSAAYLFVSTDQVRFHAIAAGASNAAPTARGPERGEPIRMEAVPEIVFSEVMRHCDLFTGVASVANDPNWIDAGAEAEHPSQWRRTVGEGYWRDTAFGDLSQSAASRKEVIAELLPSLKIAGRCRIEGNYLRVEGKVRAYKIHLGSGNILMEPDSRYLCIVKSTPKSESRVLLPFEGDATLSLILSKALLLAADDKITDEIIVRQIFR